MAIKKKLAQLAAWTSLLVVIGLIYLAFLVWKENQRVKSSVEELPSITVRSLNGTEKLLPSFPSGKVKILIRFDSNCPSCLAQGNEMGFNMDYLNDVNIYFLSTESLDRIASFRRELGFDIWKNVSFLQITEEEALQKFGSGPLPGIYIYGKNGMLLKHFRGETKIGALINSMNSE